MRLNLIPLILFVLIACRQQPAGKPTISLKDSVIRERFAWLDSLGQLDTTEPNYKLLAAYMRNDTNFFKAVRQDEQREKKYIAQFIVWHKQADHPKLSELGADEAYRFHYWAAFFPNILAFTISKKDSIIRLHYILYRPMGQYGRERDTVLNEFIKSLTMQNWDDFKKAMHYADFWGLKENNDFEGNDGDGLEVQGYLRSNGRSRSPRTALVSRWLVRESTLHEPFSLLAKFAGVKFPPFF